MSAGVPMMPGLTIRSPIRDASVVDEADDAVGEVVLIENLPRDLARGVAGADEQHALLELQRAVTRLKASRQPRIATRKTNSAETKMPLPIIRSGRTK
jgi:hypothetical protein